MKMVSMAAAQLEREGNTFRLGDYPSACAVLRRRGPTSANAHRGRSASHPRAESAPAGHPAPSRPLAVMQTESGRRTCRATGQASLVAGRELGFSGRDTGSKIDGRRLRSRGNNTPLNLKVTAAKKEAIPRDASQLIQDPASSINNIGEFVVLAVEFFRARRAQKSCAT